MDKIEKIRQEIKRRLKNYWEICFHDIKAYNEDSNVRELKELLFFLDTLSEEPDKSLEEEYMDYVVKDSDYSKLVNRIAGLGIARHFAEWGAEHLRDTTKMMDKSMEEAAKEFAKRNTRPKNSFDGVPPCCWEESFWTTGPYESFLAGEEWQYQKDREEFAKIKAKTWREGFDAHKEQMLKEAVECELYWDGDFLPIDLNMAALGYSGGDKVKVIVLKDNEDESK